MVEERSMTKPILVNVTEEIVQGLVRFILHGSEYQTFCHCEFCQMDIAADVLNHLPTVYVSTSTAREEAFQLLKTPEKMERINKQIILSVHNVGKRPHHKI